MFRNNNKLMKFFFLPCLLRRFVFRFRFGLVGTFRSRVVFYEQDVDDISDQAEANGLPRSSTCVTWCCRHELRNAKLRSPRAHAHSQLVFRSKTAETGDSVEPSQRCDPNVAEYQPFFVTMRHHDDWVLLRDANWRFSRPADPLLLVF